MDLIALTVAARTARAPGRPHLGYQIQPHHRRRRATPGSPSPSTARSARAARSAWPWSPASAPRPRATPCAPRCAPNGVDVGGELKTAELPAFVAASTAGPGLPVELARHESARLADIILRVNKWSINWLADRVIMTAAALVKREPPSMELAMSAMYDWLARHPASPGQTSSSTPAPGCPTTRGITTQELVSVVRPRPASPPAAISPSRMPVLDSLSVGGTDGTLASRFRAGDVRGRLRGKTGTLFDRDRPVRRARVRSAVARSRSRWSPTATHRCRRATSGAPTSS